MIPGSLQGDDDNWTRSAFRNFRLYVKRYFWLWIAWQTLKGLTTTTVIWAPLAYMYFQG